MTRFKTIALATALCVPLAAQADEISDTLQAAIDAYTEGDIAYALEELDFARQKLMSLRAEAFQQFLPPAPDGWTREVETEMQAGLANDVKEGGWLPEWGSPGLRNVMVGNNSASVVADAYLKNGVTNTFHWCR